MQIADAATQLLLLLSSSSPRQDLGKVVVHLRPRGAVIPDSGRANFSLLRENIRCGKWPRERTMYVCECLHISL